MEERSTLSMPVADPPRRSLVALSRLRQRLRRLHLLDGMVVVALLVLAGCVVSFVLDYLLILPVGLRAIFLAGAAFLLVVLVCRRLLAPLAVSVADEDLALLVEESHPELRQSLVTAIQLSRKGSEGARYVSGELLASVVRDVESIAATASFERIFQLRRLYRRATILVLLALALFFGLMAAPRLGGIWLDRNILLGAARWPKGTILEVFPPVPDTVAVGDDLLVEVRVLRGDPKVVTVRRRVSGGDSRGSVMDLKERGSWDVHLEGGKGDDAAVDAALERAGLVDPSAREVASSGSGLLARGLSQAAAEEVARELEAAGLRPRLEAYDLYVHEIASISHSFEFWIEGGDDRTSTFEVDVRLRPRIDMKSVRVAYRLPEYTGQGGEEQVQRHGNLKVPVGTAVSFSMATNIPVERAFLILRAGAREAGPSRGDVAPVGGEDRWPDPGAGELPVTDGRQFQGGFVVTGSGYYYFQFEDQHGFRSRKPERFRIQSIPDRKPEVRVVEPRRTTEEVSADAKVPVRVTLEDDYGIRRAVLEGLYFPPRSDNGVPQSIPLPGVGAPSPAEAVKEYSDVELTLDIAGLQTGDGGRPAPGARFEFYILAEDFGDTGRSIEGGGESARPVGNIGQSQPYMLEIVDKDILERLLTDQLMVVRDQLRQVLARQEAVRRNVEDLHDRSLIQDEVSREEARKLSGHRRDQEKIREGLGRQAGEVERILRKMEANAVGEEDWRAWVEARGDEIRDLAERQSPGVEEEMEKLLRDALDSPQDPGRVAKVLSLQRQIERDLTSLVLRLEEFGDKSAVIQLLKEARRRQAELRDRTRGLVEGEENGKEDE